MGERGRQVAVQSVRAKNEWLLQQHVPESNKYTLPAAQIYKEINI